MKKPQRGIAIENWPWQRQADVRNWLGKHFGPGGWGAKTDYEHRWGEVDDYGLQNLYMDEDVYMWYVLRWS